MKQGGYFIRGRAKDPRTGRLREVSRPLPDAASADDAQAALREELAHIRRGKAASRPSSFGDYAVSLLERKIQRAEIRAASNREQWRCVLQHHLLPAFGRVHLDELTRGMIEDWKDEIAERINGDEYAPVTANGWLRVLRVIVNTAVAELELARNPVAGVRDFDTSLHPTYTDEEPNALTPDEVPRFLDKMRELYPQHFAMAALGFATGLRPSSMRPLRRSGPTPDVLWDEGVIFVRRSHTVGAEVMERTKTGRNQRIALPPELMDILRWHVENLPPGPMRDSELLFPSETGGLRPKVCLKKPFAAVVEALGIEKRLSPRAMRRTFQDLARAAEVNDVVTRAISGHATEAMQRHYSTVSDEEKRETIARVISLAGVRALRQSAPGGVKSGVKRGRSPEANRG
jgi:integrase